MSRMSANWEEKQMEDLKSDLSYANACLYEARLKNEELQNKVYNLEELYLQLLNFHRELND